MVTTDISQLTAECNTWRSQMRHYREEFTQLKNQLRQIVTRVKQKELLQDVEHYENQFHIQLINIHDLKHSIKVHNSKAALALTGNNEHAVDIVLAEHEHINTQYTRLEQMLKELKEAFQQFLGKLN
jgi:chaperonin cofactor prefoldin